PLIRLRHLLPARGEKEKQYTLNFRRKGKEMRATIGASLSFLLPQAGASLSSFSRKRGASLFSSPRERGEGGAQRRMRGNGRGESEDAHIRDRRAESGITGTRHAGAKSAPHPPSAPSPRSRGTPLFPFFSPLAGRRRRAAPDEGQRAWRCPRMPTSATDARKAVSRELAAPGRKAPPHPPSAPSPRLRGEGKTIHPRLRGEEEQSTRLRGERKEYVLP